MSKLSKSLLALMLFCSGTQYAQFTDVINSNRPGESMAAFSVGRTVIQAEMGFRTFRERNGTTLYEAEGVGGDLAIRYGAFFEQLEFIAELDYQNEVFTNTASLVSQRNAGLKNISIGAKYLVYDPWKNYEKKPNLYSYNANHRFSWRQLIPAVGVFAAANMDVSDNKFIRPTWTPDKGFSPTIGVLTQNQFGKSVLLMNVLFDKVASQRESINYVITLTRGFSMHWSGFIEHQGFIADYYSDAIFRAGAAYLVLQNLQLDASIGANIKNDPSLLIAGLGVSWRFDANYEDVFLRIPKEEKGSKEDKKKKDKAKKRKDEIEQTEGVPPSN